MKYQCIVGTVIMALLVTAANAMVWYVHPDSAQNCIQDCLDSCSTGDTVLVGPGVYSEHITWPNTQGIDLTSEYGADMTYIDGGGTDHVLSITTVVDTATKISGFTVQYGYAEYGAGILCSNGASPIITGNLITQNTSYGDGGAGILIFNASPVITDNTIEHNSATNGAGGGMVIHTNSNPLIANNTIKHNTCDLGGGGIISFVGCSPTISSNDVDSNSAFSGGGICCQTSLTSIINNTITSNNAERGGGMYFTQYDSSIVTGNIITGNTANWGGGISCKTGSVPNITYCSISDNDGDGVYCWDYGTPLINYNNIENNAGYGVRNMSYVLINAENNWWGDASGPYHSSNPGGLGDTVSDYVDYDPWLDEPPGVEEYTASSPVLLNLQVSPNPFTNLTTISYSIGQSVKCMAIQIYDVTGRLVRNLYDAMPHAPCSMQITWDGHDSNGTRLPEGAYFCRITVGEHGLTQKVVLME